MRFFSLLLPFVLASDVLSSSLPKRRSNFHPQAKTKSRGAAPTTPNELGLTKRQLPGALIGLTLCAQLGADVELNTGGLGGLLGLDQLLDLGVEEELCICVAGGVLTDDSVGIIQTRVDDRTSAVIGLLKVLTADAAVNAIANALIVLLGRAPYSDQCGYPANSIPLGCNTDCEYTCAEGFTRCGRQCLLSCPSNIPAAGGAGAGRRSLHGLGMSADLLCPKGLSACGIAAPGRGGKLLVRGKFECLDTASDVETCGGCIIPLPGRPQGTDCTALPFVMDVSCVQGRCIAQTCEKGYEAVDGACVEVRANAGGQETQSLLGLDLQLAADLGLGALKA